jgi:phosphate:Na+ symporter
VPARRTALAQIVFNLFAGALAFAALPLFLMGLRLLLERGVSGPEAIAVFHTAFNLAAVGLVLPFVGAYSRLIERWVPERGTSPTRHLDPSLRTLPEVAVEAARRSVAGIGAELVGSLRALLADPHEHHRLGPGIRAMETALTEVRDFLAGVRSAPEAGSSFQRHLGVLHAVDHLERLAGGIQATRPAAVLAEGDPALRAMADELASRLEAVVRWLESEGGPSPVPEVAALSERIAGRRRAERPEVMERAAAGSTDPRAALRQLDAMRWLDRVTYHLWRALYHLAGPAAGDHQEERRK